LVYLIIGLSFLAVMADHISDISYLFITLFSVTLNLRFYS